MEYGDMYKLECELIAPVPIEKAFSVFENPYNLAQITPPWLNFRILTEGLEMKRGAEIDYEFRWIGVPLRWRTVITEYEPPVGFVDKALKSPYSLWHHRHTFRETPQGTLVGDRVDYSLPFGHLGRMAHAAIVNKQLRAIFDYRQKAIIEMLGGRVTELRAPTITALR
jgi:ligand-binding SRPBCC domain-containing protein